MTEADFFPHAALSTAAGSELDPHDVSTTAMTTIADQRLATISAYTTIPDVSADVGYGNGHSRPRRSFLQCVLLFSLVIQVGCRHKQTGSQTQSSTQDSTVVAEIDGEPITATDLISDVANRSPYYRLQFRSPEGQAKIREELLRFEVMAKEARDRGLEKDPEVVRTLKQQMVNRLIQSEERGPDPAIPDSAIEQYYTAHAADFSQAEVVHVQQLVVSSRARALSAWTSAGAFQPSDEQRFRELVRRVSEDQDGRARAGDEIVVERTARGVPKAVIEAAFEVDKFPSLIGPVETERGFYILRVLERTRKTVRPLSEVRSQITKRLVGEARAKEMDEWEAKVKAKHDVKVFEDKFSALDMMAARTPPP